MASYSHEVSDNIGGGGFMGGGNCIWLVAVVVLWLLFRDGRGFGNDGFEGRGHRHGGDCGCNCHGVRPAFYDESNYEQDKYLCGKFDKEYEAIRGEGEKTRTLIENNYIQDLRDRLAASEAEKQTLKSEAFTRAEIGGVKHMIEEIRCHMPIKRPEYACTVTPCCGELPVGCGNERPRRSDFDGCGCF